MNIQMEEKPSWWIPVYDYDEEVQVPEKEREFDAGNGGSNGGPGGSGGGGGDDGNGDPNRNTNTLSADQKYAQFGRVAKDILRYKRSRKFRLRDPTMMQEFRDLAVIRGIMNGINFPFTPAFDLVSRKIFFYSTDQAYYEKYKQIKNIGVNDYYYRELEDGKYVKFKPVLLNQDTEYVKNNIMRIDNDETCLNDKSQMPDHYVFVRDAEIIKHVLMILSLNSRAEKNQIEKVWETFGEIEYSYKFFAMGILNKVIGRLYNFGG